MPHNLLKMPQIAAAAKEGDRERVSERVRGTPYATHACPLAQLVQHEFNAVPCQRRALHSHEKIVAFPEGVAHGLSPPHVLQERFQGFGVQVNASLFIAFSDYGDD